MKCSEMICQTEMLTFMVHKEAVSDLLAKFEAKAK